jgi:hypothetical protein
VTGATDLFEVRMLGTPLVLRERSRQQGADLLREMALIRTGGASGGRQAHSPIRLLELAHELDTAYGPYVATNNSEMDAALDRGEDTLDEVVYQLPTAAVTFIEHVRDILIEVEQYCRSDTYLLILEPAPEIAAYRNWSMEQVLTQYRGEPPTSWPDYAAARGLG